MDDSGPTASYIIFFALLLIDIIFYSFGAAVKELSAKELSDQIEATGSKKAKRLYEIVVNPERYINTVQMVVTLMNLVLGILLFQLFGKDLVTLLIAGAILLYIVLTFGVLLPKKLGARYASGWAFANITLIYYITWFLLPFTGLVSLST